MRLSHACHQKARNARAAYRSKRAELRAALSGYDGARIDWRERRLLFGSELSMTGPAAAVRQAHAAAVSWLHPFPLNGAPRASLSFRSGLFRCTQMLLYPR